MPIWLKDYRFKKEDYKTLIEALRRPNKYRYAILLEKNPGLSSVRKGRFRVFELPEGCLILSRYPRVRVPGGYLSLTDLKNRSIRLVSFVISLENDRIRLRVNRDYLRRLIKKIHALSSSAYWYGSKRKFQKDYLKAVNQIIREGNDLINTCFVYPESIQAFNRKVRRIVFKFLTSVLGLKSAKAKEVIDKYLTKLKKTTKRFLSPSYQVSVSERELASLF